MIRLAQRRFGYADQERFASVSGDRNPMHCDALQARRTQAGAPVVHGIHTLLWALDALAEARPELPPLRALRAQFNKFVYVDEAADVVLTRQGSEDARLNILADGGTRSKISLEFGNPAKHCPRWSSTSLEQVPLALRPLVLSFEQISGRSGRLSFATPPAEAAMLFPSVTKWLGAQRVAALAASTYLVGMVCPGLHSIYGELLIETCTECGSAPSLAFRVTETDPRFRSVEQEIAGGELSGTVRSFVRVPPVSQAPMESLAGIVNPAEFAGSLALIIGGSRGLGELTAKLIATGGGRVVVTWQSGRDDAEGVAEEIRSAGGACETIAYDARKPACDQIAALANAPTHAYYFATPHIYRPGAEILSAGRLNEFLAIYVDGFWRLANALRARQPMLSMFYPSSVYVAERPRGMTEYAIAKAAGEVLCADMNVSLAPLRVTAVRLPPLATDQTASITAGDTADPLGSMLPIVRTVQSWPRK